MPLTPTARTALRAVILASALVSVAVMVCVALHCSRSSAPGEEGVQGVRSDQAAPFIVIYREPGIPPDTGGAYAVVWPGGRIIRSDSGWVSPSTRYTQGTIGKPDEERWRHAINVLGLDETIPDQQVTVDAGLIRVS